MEIKVITTDCSDKFTKLVNDLLKDGWEFHGEPHINHVAQQATWGNDRLRAWVETRYTQVLKKTQK